MLYKRALYTQLRRKYYRTHKMIKYGINTVIHLNNLVVAASAATHDNLEAGATTDRRKAILGRASRWRPRDASRCAHSGGELPGLRAGRVLV